MHPVTSAARKRVEANLAKARARSSLQAFDKLTHVVDGERRIISDPPLIQPIGELFEELEREQIHELLRGVIRGYRRTLQSDRRHLLEEFRLVDMARKVVGVGSVGTRAWIILMLGRDETDPLFLQAKEAQASVLEEFVGHSDGRSPGERVVHGQHLMQASSDIFLGWRDRRLPRQQRRLRLRDRGVLRGVRRPERTGLRRPRAGREGRTDQRPARSLSHRRTWVGPNCEGPFTFACGFG